MAAEYQQSIRQLENEVQQRANRVEEMQNRLERQGLEHRKVEEQQDLMIANLTRDNSELIAQNKALIRNTESLGAEQKRQIELEKQVAVYSASVATLELAVQSLKEKSRQAEEAKQAEVDKLVARNHEYQEELGRLKKV